MISDLPQQHFISQEAEHTALGPPSGYDSICILCMWSHVLVFFCIEESFLSRSTAIWELHRSCCSALVLSPSHFFLILPFWCREAVVIMLRLIIWFGKGLQLLLACHFDRPRFEQLRMRFIPVTVFILIQTFGLKGPGWFLRQGWWYCCDGTLKPLQFDRMYVFNQCKNTHVKLSDIIFCM